MTLLRTVTLLNRLADPGQRAAAAAELARHWNAEALFIFVPDPELGVLRPALGFQQTLPGGPTWRRLLDRCNKAGEYIGEVAFPDRHIITNAYAYVADDGAVLLLVGAAPSLTYTTFKALPFALLAALVRAETAASGIGSGGGGTRWLRTLPAGDGDGPCPEAVVAARCFASSHQPSSARRVSVESWPPGRQN